MKINKNQFKDSKSGVSRISELNTFDIISNEGIHTYEDHAMIHIVFWKNLSSEQEATFLKGINEMYSAKQLIGMEVLGDGEYKFYLKYAELI